MGRGGGGLKGVFLSGTKGGWGVGFLSGSMGVAGGVPILELFTFNLSPGVYSSNPMTNDHGSLLLHGLRRRRCK